ncbi:MAG: hypothetical protein IVW53_11940 [Chloroflexi bacterium]|nr:hypothetical protein [Chloroflexota bacterium]
MTGLLPPDDPTRDEPPPISPGAPADPPTDPSSLSSLRAVPYKGSDLDGDRGPGLGCFRFQIAVLVLLIVLTPIGVNAGWPDWVTAAFLFATIGLLLVTGQTIIFLLRLVAADRRGRRRPLASVTPTVGEIQEAGTPDASATPNGSATTDTSAPPDTSGPPEQDDGRTPDSAVRQ